MLYEYWRAQECVPGITFRRAQLFQEADRFHRLVEAPRHSVGTLAAPLPADPIVSAGSLNVGEPSHCRDRSNVIDPAFLSRSRTLCVQQISEIIGGADQPTLAVVHRAAVLPILSTVLPGDSYPGRGLRQLQAES